MSAKYQKMVWCPSCLKHAPNAKACFRDIGGEWTCENCSHVLGLARHHKTPTRTTMTPSQKKTLELLKTTILRLEGGKEGDRAVEFKMEETKVERGLLFLRLELGLKGDEGTYAEILGRRRWHIAVGPSGGVSPVYWDGPKVHEPKSIFDIANGGTDWQNHFKNPRNQTKRGSES